MGAIVSYFRTHPWQRRVLTAMAAIILGLIAAIIAFPHYRDYTIIRDLGSSDESVRTDAIQHALYLAEHDERFLGRLYDSLDTESDAKFKTIMGILSSLENAPQPAAIHIDRMRLMRFVHSSDNHDNAACEHILLDTVLSERDNRYVRKMLEAAHVHESPDVRILAGMLAASLGDDKTLEKLLADKDDAVAAAAALDAALGGRTGLAAKTADMLAKTESRAVMSDAAYATAILDAGLAGPEICKRLMAIEDDPLRDRLLHAASMLDNDEVRKVVRELLESQSRNGKYPSAETILAAGKLGMKEVVPYVRAVLRDVVAGKSGLHESHVLAAIDAAERLGVPVGEELLELIPGMWTYEVTAVCAIELLAEQISKLPADDALRRNAVKLFRQAASQAYTEGATMLPSTAAAVALWILNEDPDDKAVRNLAASEAFDPGDYISWRLSLAEPERAFELGMRMLPPPFKYDVPLEEQPPRVHNNNERCCGAMLLGLAARTPGQKADAIARIQSRIDEILITDFVEMNTLKCAMIILNASGADHEKILWILISGDFPRRRSMTALLAAGEKKSLDWLLLSGISDDNKYSFIVDYQIGDLLKKTTPQLPHIDAAAEEDLAMWQLKILCHAYAIKRKSLKPGLPR